SSISFPKLEELWKQTTKYRLNEIANSTGTSEILKKWHHYTQPLGYRLIDVDFKTLYSNCSDIKYGIEEKLDVLSKLLKEQIKDTESKKMLEYYGENLSNISENGKHTVFFYLLHGLLVPTAKKMTKDHTGKKSIIKYSIKDSQNSFMVFKNSVPEMEDYIISRRNENVPIQPFIIICGTTFKPKEIIIFFDCIKYKMFSFISAIDICFKIFHIFNLEYPVESYIVWLFIQKYFYDINTKYDKACHTLGRILSDLKNF
ncbi:Uncharacterized protein FWK35_00028828, partial [Aphis craccivora]